MAKNAKSEVVSNVSPVTQSLADGGVIQIVEAPKAEYVVSVADAQQIDNIVDMFIDAEEHLYEGDVGMQNTAVAMSRVMGSSPSYAEWNTKRALWLRKFMAKTPSASEESAQKAWERLARRMDKECGLVKPKAPSAAAKKMSEKRKAEAEMLAGLDDSQLVDLLVAYKNQDDLDKAKRVKQEMKRRNADAEAEVNDQRKALRELIRKQVAQTTDIELLEKVSAMLPKLVEKSE